MAKSIAPNSPAYVASRTRAEANPEIRFFTLEQADFGLPNACDVLVVLYGPPALRA